jgi:hypothetical protein
LARRRRLDYMRGQRPPLLAGEEESGSRLRFLGVGIHGYAPVLSCCGRRTSWRRGGGSCRPLLVSRWAARVIYA